MKSITLAIALLAIALPPLAGCNIPGCGALVSDDNTVEAVMKQGYSDVQIKASHIFFVSWHGCGDSDRAAYKMAATNALGQRVDLIVCAGWPFKGVTVRTE